MLNDDDFEKMWAEAMAAQKAGEMTPAQRLAREAEFERRVARETKVAKSTNTVGTATIGSLKKIAEARKLAKAAGVPEEVAIAALLKESPEVGGVMSTPNAPAEPFGFSSLGTKERKAIEEAMLAHSQVEQADAAARMQAFVQRAENPAKNYNPRKHETTVEVPKADVLGSEVIKSKGKTFVNTPEGNMKLGMTPPEGVAAKEMDDVLARFRAAREVAPEALEMKQAIDSFRAARTTQTVRTGLLEEIKKKFPGTDAEARLEAYFKAKGIPQSAIADILDKAPVSGTGRALSSVVQKAKAVAAGVAPKLMAHVGTGTAPGTGHAVATAAKMTAEEAPSVAKAIGVAAAKAAPVAEEAGVLAKAASAAPKVGGIAGLLGKLGPALELAGAGFAVKQFVLDPLIEGVESHNLRTAQTVMDMREASAGAKQEQDQLELARALASQADLEDQADFAIQGMIHRASQQLSPEEQQALGAAGQPYQPLPWEMYAKLK